LLFCAGLLFVTRGPQLQRTKTKRALKAASLNIARLLSRWFRRQSSSL
jgi:hypothetical protein